MTPTIKNKRKISSCWNVNLYLLGEKSRGRRCRFCFLYGSFNTRYSWVNDMRMNTHAPGIDPQAQVGQVEVVEDWFLKQTWWGAITKKYQRKQKIIRETFFHPSTECIVFFYAFRLLISVVSPLRPGSTSILEEWLSSNTVPSWEQSSANGTGRSCLTLSMLFVNMLCQ